MAANKTITSHQCVSSTVTLVLQPSLARGQGANNAPQEVPPHLLQARIGRALIAVHWGVICPFPRRGSACHAAAAACQACNQTAVVIVVVHDAQDLAVEEDVQLGEGMHPCMPCAGRGSARTHSAPSSGMCGQRSGKSSLYLRKKKAHTHKHAKIMITCGLVVVACAIPWSHRHHHYLRGKQKARSPLYAKPTPGKRPPASCIIGIASQDSWTDTADLVFALEEVGREGQEGGKEGEKVKEKSTPGEAGIWCLGRKQRETCRTTCMNGRDIWEEGQGRKARRRSSIGTAAYPRRPICRLPAHAAANPFHRYGPSCAVCVRKG
ncbi:hypothetical protein F5148DRAFT_1147505 [Russula earlei]|uniref:Uncharacterized protein n=1 Tax=Russula earlei TaxID=71964 RepID=A0ACC0UFZ0_9AGAM|nr:hypothetical protein F5148DRAFT_1147505 [Russula earlei]